MKSTTGKLLSLLLALAMLLPGAGLLSVLSEAETTYKVGDIIEFGGYPQTKVTDDATLSALNARVTKSDWVSYGYYAYDKNAGEGVPGDWMKYCDIELDGAKYRGVTFSQYRPIYTSSGSPSAHDSPQCKAGYYVDRVYWFKYEPLKWRVLDPGTGLVLCESVIDSQPYTVYTKNTDVGNDYDQSFIRMWLNNTFVGTAFSGDELALIDETKLNNNDAAGGNRNSTTDRIFMLSKDEVNRNEYGLDGGAVPAYGTDYARSQGAHEKEFTVVSNNSWTVITQPLWRLRTPAEGNEKAVVVGMVTNPDTNDYFFEYNVAQTNDGIRPAFSFKDGIRESVNPNGHTHNWSDWTGDGLDRHVRTCSLCGANDYADHTWGDWTYTIRPTCLAWGAGSRACTECGYARAETIPPDPDNHSKKYTVITAATCKAEGERSAVCTRCGKDLGTEAIPVDPSAHVWNDGVAISGSQIKYTCTLCGKTKTVSAYQNGDTFQFGAYPQTRVTSAGTISALNERGNSATWYSYRYSSGTGSYGSMQAGDWMQYCDVTYGTAKYRGVKFTNYRPSSTIQAATDANSGQDEQGYTTNTTYWFKWEPLYWRVLHPGNADKGFESLVVCEKVIDAQAFSNTVYFGKPVDQYGHEGDPNYFSDAAFQHYMADYSASSLRHWLINDFYNTAFSAEERQKIKYSEIEGEFYRYYGYDYHVPWDGRGRGDYIITDKVFALSYSQAKQYDYWGSGVNNNNAETRGALPTDYALCQGGLSVSSITGTTTWWLSTGISETALYGAEVINRLNSYNVNGVRPAFSFVDDIIEPSNNSAGGNGIYADDAELSHTWDKGAVITAATCNAEGEKVFTCLNCGEVKTETIPLADHDWNSWKSAGEKQHMRVCKTDASHVQYEDHAWNAGMQTKPPTCAADGVTTYTCTVCKTTRKETVDKLPHAWGEWAQYDEEYHVRVCANDEEHKDYVLHSWDSGKETKPTTTAAEGEKTFTCTVCKATKTEPIPMLPSSITVTGGTASLASAVKGTGVTVTASAPPEGKAFEKWEVVKGGVKLADETKATTTFVMGSSPVEIKAVFKDLPPAEHSITVTSGTASVASAAKGVTVVITAAAAPEGKVFDKWEVIKGGVTLADDSQGRTSFVMGDENVEVKATYKDASVQPSVMLGDVDGNGEINSADARLCLRRAVDLETYEKGSDKFIACDVDKNNEVTSADARKILRAAVDLEDPAKW